MRTIQLGTHTVTLHNSAKELPANRYSQHQKYCLLDIGVGSDSGSIERHFERLDKFIASAMVAEAAEERTNLHFNLFYQLQEVNFKGLAFACLVHEIDGVPLTDFSEENLQKVIDTLSEFGLSQTILENELDQVKKKLEGELKGYFPEYFSDDALVNLLAQLQQKNALQLQYLLTEENAILPRVTEIEKHLLSTAAPQNFDLNDPKNAVYQHESAFEALCTQLEDAGAQSVATLSVFSFYHKVRYYDRKFKSANNE